MHWGVQDIRLPEPVPHQNRWKGSPGYGAKACEGLSVFPSRPCAAWSNRRERSGSHAGEAGIPPRLRRRPLLPAPYLAELIQFILGFPGKRQGVRIQIDIDVRLQTDNRLDALERQGPVGCQQTRHGRSEFAGIFSLTASTPL